jgi:transcriptional regulator with XRE-family HTH domain
MADVMVPGDPEWDLADRMRKALRFAGMHSGAMAAYLDVERSTISRWLNGRIVPSTQTLRLWAMRTGVSYEWLARPKGFEPLTSWFGVMEYLPEPAELRLVS